MQNQEIKSMITEIFGLKSKINACRSAFWMVKYQGLFSGLDKDYIKPKFL